MHRILCVAGARPNFMKVAPILAALGGHPRLEGLLVHTGQHYDHGLSQAFFDDLGMPAPALHLGVGSLSHAKQTAAVMVAFEEACARLAPALVVVVGDVNSTVAAALVACKLHLPVAHVEAGLRSGDRRMPEEINRVVTDRLSRLLLAPSQDGVDNLVGEGVPREWVHLVGNVMIDTLQRHRKRAASSPIREELGVAAGAYGVLTLHRPSNVDVPEVLEELLETLCQAGERLPLILPVHPRTKARLQASELWERAGSAPGLRLVEPLGYLDFLHLMAGARLVLTDSGGLQEETTALGIPCFTLRENTERPITISQGTNQLVGRDRAAILAGVEGVLAGRSKAGRIPPFWDGETANRIVAVLDDYLMHDGVTL